MLLLFIQACTMSASQETTLNNAKTSFIKSKNEGVVMSYVAYTLPEVVSFYKSSGDSSFQKRFDLSEENRPYLSDGNLRQIESKDEVIHVRYEFNNSDLERGEKESIFALSKNDGKSWFFVERDDYYNDAIFPSEKRLINKE